MIREAILHFDPLQTQVKTECIDQNGLRSVKFIENEDLMRAIRQHTYTTPLHSGLLPPNCVALTAHKEQWTVTLASDCNCYDVFYHNTAYGFSLCVGSNVFTGYDTPRKLRTLLHRVMAVPFGDDYYRPEQTRLNLGARELFEHLKDKTPAYYYENVLIVSGKTLSDFLGGAV